MRGVPIGSGTRMEISPAASKALGTQDLWIPEGNRGFSIKYEPKDWLL